MILIVYIFKKIRNGPTKKCVCVCVMCDFSIIITVDEIKHLHENHLMFIYIRHTNELNILMIRLDKNGNASFASLSLEVIFDCSIILFRCSSQIYEKEEKNASSNFRLRGGAVIVCMCMFLYTVFSSVCMCSRLTRFRWISLTYLFSRIHIFTCCTLTISFQSNHMGLKI